MTKKSFLSTFLLSIVLLCSACSGPSKQKSLEGQKKAITEESNKQNNQPDPQKKKKFIVLFHGLCNSATEMDEAKDELEGVFGSDVKIIALDEPNMHGKSIEQQARDAHDVLKKEDGILEGNVAFLGGSQGALRAYTVFRLFGNEFKGKKCLVSAVGPWKGAEVLSNLEPIKSFLKSSEEQGQKLPLLSKLAQDLKQVGAGVNDIKPNSTFLNTTHSSLANNDIPMFLVSGGIGNTDQVIKNLDNEITVGDDSSVKTEKQKKEIIQMTTKFLKEMAKLMSEKEHDYVLTIDSQKAEGINIKNAERRMPSYKYFDHWDAYKLFWQDDTIKFIRKHLEL